MNKPHYTRILIAFCAALLLALFNPTLHAAPTSSAPKQMDLGGVKWTLGNDAHNNDSRIVEYIPTGENIDHWTQLLTFQQFKLQLKDNVTPKMIAENEMVQLKKEYPDAYFAITDANNTEAMIEFRISKPADKQQNEIQRIILPAPNTVIFIHYVTRKADMGNDARAIWNKVLKNATPPFAN